MRSIVANRLRCVEAYDCSGSESVSGEATNQEIVSNFSILNGDAIGRVPVTLPPRTFFRTRRICLDIVSGDLGR